MHKLVWGVVLSFCFLINSAWAGSLETVVIRKETANFDLQLKYPQGFADKTIDIAVKKLIDNLQKADTNTDSSDSLADEGKSSLYVDYKIKFQNRNATSLLFMISTYTSGAAHPNNTVQSLNFIQGKEMTLAQLFKPDSGYLTKIAALGRAAVLKKKISDNDWVISGTKPTQENYQNWYFTADGLAIVFDTYQVAAYVYGPQTVKISRSELGNWLRPEVAKVVWGN
ncbi:MULTISPECIES: DUF3298 and DUF4163 domain-containing protein [unclassified Legionella]|uniref:DUF3298 and DUF4163 domain-containing protein n=1 Tax=unclassified Legionella TaxID=2622702 RepID=UPI0010547C49|nr:MULTISPECIES: DUF3298 and DUF4163 domain-containing protein [unclassified Legionella]MDI9818154.1 DUF3298 domain-containing protein [Legionella sp. PL877]